MNLGVFRGAAAGEIAVIGLGRSGRAVAELLVRDGHTVYASDGGAGDSLRRAADELRALGAEAEIGGHDLARIARAALVVASPGVPPDAPPLAAAHTSGRQPVGEIEIALHYLPGLRYVAVTGTNGKTTTTALIGRLLRALGHDAPDAGNIGTPLAAVALADRKPDWVALELSSFQLHDTPSVRPTVGVLTNLSPDHLDRYADVEAYYADKALLFRNAHAGARWVVNADDAGVQAMSGGVAGDHHHFSLRDATAEAALVRDQLVFDGRPLLARADFRLLGDHNVANALAAVLAVSVADPAHRSEAARATMAGELRTFGALAHRMEPVGTYGGVEWINDSKATNVSSTRVALHGMHRPYVLLLGGRHKGEPYTTLAEPLARHGVAVLAYGEAADEIVHDLGPHVRVERLGSSFADVVRRARELAPPGGAVLLSPACSSYDMFANYEERGAEFRRLAGGAER